MNQTTKTYQHLRPEERATIMLGLEAGKSLSSIARLLGRSPSTISRELKRNAAASTTYSAVTAAEAYSLRRQRSRRRRKLEPGTPLFSWVRDRLIYNYWSPQQIALRLRRMPEQNRPGLVSHETIYAAIYAHAGGSLKKEMIQALRRAKPKRGRRRTSAARGASFVPDSARIVNRPEEIEHRLIPGHWEGDFIKGAFNRSAVGTLVDRKTRYVILCKMEDCTAQSALESFTRQMKRLPASFRQSLTYDRGSEMACHEELSKRLKIDIWFADPHAPWQRGTNENTNGLIRQFLPKGVDLSQFSQTYLNDIARLLNGRPRAALDGMTPEEAKAEEMRKFRENVALDS